jgi:hypothetical protein
MAIEVNIVILSSDKPRRTHDAFTSVAQNVKTRSSMDCGRRLVEGNQK